MRLGFGVLLSIGVDKIVLPEETDVNACRFAGGTCFQLRAAIEAKDMSA